MRFQKRAVENSADIRRVLALPARVWDTATTEAAVSHLTRALRTHNGEQTLREKQAQALAEFPKTRGLFLPLGVGEGKTLISMLAPIVFGARAPLLIVPAALVQKTEDDRVRYARDWQVARHLRIRSYEKLSLVQSQHTLERIDRPDLLIVDEGHRLKNPRAGVTKRVARYLAEHPETAFIYMSGSALTKRLSEISRLMYWALRDGSPLPSSDEETMSWGDAIDEASDGAMWRTDPGALLQFAHRDDRDEPDLVRARRGLRRRIHATPGVIASTGETTVTASLRIVGEELDVNDATEANFKTLRERWATPDGWVFESAIQIWALAKQLALGFHYIRVDAAQWDGWRARLRTDPGLYSEALEASRLPEFWLQPKKEWSVFVRETLADRPDLDTPLQVAIECREGRLSDHAYRPWVGVRDQIKVFKFERWHDDAALVACERWMAERAGIVWCEHVFFAAELARRTGRPFYSNGACDAAGRAIEASRPKEGSIIASIAACCTGQNLQAWDRNLITSPMSRGDWWQQLLGRTHRHGQTSDEVTADAFVACWEHHDAWQKALSSARMVADISGERQRILSAADVVWPTAHEVGPRWSKVDQQDAHALLRG